jgi:hypothetical protein
MHTQLNSMDFPQVTHRMGAPANWDEEAYGNCDVLPVCYQDGVSYSYWRFGWKQRLAILFGYPLRLAVVGRQVPVALEILDDPNKAAK